MSGESLWDYIAIGLIAMQVLAGVAQCALHTRWWRAVWRAYSGLFFATTYTAMLGWGVYLGLSNFDLLCICGAALINLTVFLVGLRQVLGQLRQERQGSAADEDL